MISKHLFSAPYGKDASPFNAGCLSSNLSLLKSIITSPGRKTQICGKWSDGGTVPCRAGVPDPNALSKDLEVVLFATACCESTGDYPGSTWDELKGDLAKLSRYRGFLTAFGDHDTNTTPTPVNLSSSLR